jgi:uncharacterized damage-inducible protein DinB
VQSYQEVILKRIKRVTTPAIVALVILGGWTQSARAQNQPKMAADLAAGLLARFNESAAKLEQLAEAIPAEKYSWRPSPGIRSVSEVLVHVAMGNYYTTEDAGVPRPNDLPRNAERVITEKSEVITFLKRANAHLRSALLALSVDDLSRSTTMFEQKTTYGNVYLFGIGHVHEHQGQLVAYARMIGVTPPWSEGH